MILRTAEDLNNSQEKQEYQAFTVESAGFDVTSPIGTRNLEEHFKMVSRNQLLHAGGSMNNIVEEPHEVEGGLNSEEDNLSRD